MKFTKMQGLGNDYVYLDCTKETPKNLPELAVRMSRRGFGVGADGLICICPSSQADVKMRMFNADGSEGEMCGNGIRCVGKFVYDKGLVPKRELTVETLAGIRRLWLQTEGGQVAAATVDMGEPAVAPDQILEVGEAAYRVTPVSVGNPHAVVFWDGIERMALKTLGPQFERHPAFPNRTNAEFVEVASPNHLRVRVWERGSGETLACGTGACAALAAAVSAGRARREAVVSLPGGDLRIFWPKDKEIYMTGPAVTVYEGEYDNGSDQ